jgi:hypothetical protein
VKENNQNDNKQTQEELHHTSQETHSFLTLAGMAIDSEIGRQVMVESFGNAEYDRRNKIMKALYWYLTSAMDALEISWHNNAECLDEGLAGMYYRDATCGAKIHGEVMTPNILWTSNDLPMGCSDMGSDAELLMIAETIAHCIATSMLDSCETATLKWTNDPQCMYTCPQKSKITRSITPCQICETPEPELLTTEQCLIIAGMDMEDEPE